MISFRVLTLVLVGLLLAACNTLAPRAMPTAAVIAPVIQPKQLATVYASPTPNEAERQATRMATTPTQDPFPSVTPPPTATVYVGVFLGETGASGPVITSGILDGGLPTPTRFVTRCQIEANAGVFGTAWRANGNVVRLLGCAIEDVFPFNGTAQNFENGVMYLRPEGQMWAIAVGDPGSYWVLEQAPETSEATGQITIDTPAGLLPPAPAFVPMWLGVEGVRDALGFAQFGAAEGQLIYQRFEGGTLLYDDSTGQTFVLLLSGAAYGPYN